MPKFWKGRPYRFRVDLSLSHTSESQTKAGTENRKKESSLIWQILGEQMCAKGKGN